MYIYYTCACNRQRDCLIVSNKSSLTNRQREKEKTNKQTFASSIFNSRFNCASRSWFIGLSADVSSTDARFFPSCAEEPLALLRTFSAAHLVASCVYFFPPFEKPSHPFGSRRSARKYCALESGHC